MKVKTLFIASICVLSVLVTGHFYLNKISNTVALKVSEYIYQKTGRKMEISSASYSLIDGVTLKNMVVKEKDGKTDFFGCEMAAIKLNIKKLIGGKILFEKVKFYNGRLQIIKEGQTWNFNDLVDIMPSPKKPAYLLWNDKYLSFEKFDFYIIFDRSKNEILVSDTNFSIEHRSSTGGNFSILLSGYFSGFFDSRPFSLKLKSIADIVFDYATVKSARADIELEDISYGQISASRARLNGYLLLTKNLSGKNLKLDFLLKNLFIPSSEKLASKAFSIIQKLERATGKNILLSKDISLENLNLHLNSHRGFSELNFRSSSTILSFELNSNSSLNPGRDKIKAMINAGQLNLNIDAESNFSEVFFKQNLSETSSKVLRELILEFENNVLLKIFL